MRREREPQRRGRCDRVLAGTPPQDAPGAALARGDRESPQQALVARAEPRERGSALGRAQCLLVRPQLVGARAAADDHEPREIEPRGSERGRVGHVRRCDPDDVAAVRLQLRERGQHEPELADALAGEQDLGQRARGPAAARQHGVELRKARGHRRRLGRAVAAAPDRGIRKDGGERRVGGRHREALAVPAQSAPPPIAFAARRSSSSGGTSSTCVARYQW